MGLLGPGIGCPGERGCAMPKDADGAEKKARRRRKTRNSFKGALIKGMTRRLPIQLLGDLSFQEGLEKIMRG